jgi:trans-2,3-dihydro-3-hydroxyanthranilate isomerase
MPTSLHSYRYRVVDVFTLHALEGNPLAVFPDASGIDDVTMQRIAKELNLSETVFFVPATRPNCAVGVRIFTPARELPFAGHPTVGAGFVLLDEGIVPQDRTSFVLDEKIGPVPVRVEAGDGGRPLIWLTTPPIHFGGSYDRVLCAQALGLGIGDFLDASPETVSAGNHFVFVALRDKDAVDRASLDASGAQLLRHPNQELVGVFVFAPAAGGAYSRMFAPGSGVVEDPATGSATGPLAAYMMRHGLISATDGTRFVSEQGTKMGRRSILHVLIHGEKGADGIEVGGYVSPIVEATMTLPTPCGTGL